MMKQAYRPGIILNKMSRADEPGAEGCWLGGEPTLPPEVEWPWLMVDGKEMVPMHHLAQINLAQLPRSNPYPVPNSGTLFFFYAPVISPIYSIDGAVIIYTDTELTAVNPRVMPEFPDLNSIDDDPYFPSEYENKQVPLKRYSRWNIDFLEIESYETPLLDFREAYLSAREFNEDQFEEVERKTSVRVLDEPGGLSDFSQHHMFASRGAQEPEGIRILSLHSDGDLGFVVGDWWWLTFWIDSNALAVLDFNNIRTVEET